MAVKEKQKKWIPACAGMTKKKNKISVIRF